MNRRVTLVALVAIPLMLAACASLLGPRQVNIPVERLQQSLAKRFPFNNRYLELLDIRLAQPRLTMLPESNRLLAQMDVSVAPPFLKQAVSGSLSVSGALRFDPARNTLVLAEPLIERFEVPGLDPLYASQIRIVGTMLADQLFRQMPIYTFEPEQFRYAGTRFVPTTIQTRSNGLVVTFEPAR